MRLFHSQTHSCSHKNRYISAVLLVSAHGNQKLPSPAIVSSQKRSSSVMIPFTSQIAQSYFPAIQRPLFCIFWAIASTKLRVQPVKFIEAPWPAKLHNLNLSLIMPVQ